MNWQTKSRIQRVCAALPGGGKLYYAIQRTAGRLRNYDFERRFMQHAACVKELQQHGVAVEGARIFEVGTGWVPLMPIGYWLCGAREVVTCDLNRYLSWALLREALEWLAAHPDRVREIWRDAAAPDRIALGLETIQAHAESPKRFLDAAAIRYDAPADATQTAVESETFDLHTSVSVWEHVEPGVLPGILAEANRMLRPGAYAYHIVDPTDHFAHGDASIPLIHFLRFDDAHWRRYNDNQWAYCNRLFDSDYVRLWEESPLRLAHHSSILDEESLRQLQSGFPLATEFADRNPEDLSRRELHYLGQKPV